MDFRIFIVEQFFDKNIVWVCLQVLIFILVYLFFFRNQIWGIFDPLFMASLTMGGAAFCVWSLYYNSYVDRYFIYSFLATEVALIISMIMSYSFFSVKRGKKSIVVSDYKKVDLFFLNIFLLISGSFVTIFQFLSFYSVGIVALQEGVNHVSAYDGHGSIRALLVGFRSIFVIAFFYKMVLYKLNWIDKLFFIIYISGIVLSGSKSALLIPVLYYLILNYYFYKRGLVQRLRVKLKWLLLLGLFPIFVIIITTDASFIQAMLMFGARIIASGDIFVLGYDRDVMNSITEKSFFKYLFYPGFGTILKNFGLSIIPPETIGPDIYDYYYGIRTGGPNARHNYLGLLFLGPYFSILYSALCGFLIGFVRGCFTSKNRNFFNLIFFVILYNSILSLIIDVNIFMNSFVWSFLLLIMVYSISNILFNFYKKL